MKKIFAALCVLLLVPTMASAGGERVSLSELKAQTPAAVEGTHEAYARTGRMIDPEDETAGRYVYAL